MVAQLEERFDTAFERSRDYTTKKADWLEGTWAGLESTTGFEARRGKTGVAVETLREVGAAITRVPEGFAINRKIERQLRRKRKILEDGEGVTGHSPRRWRSEH